MSTSNQQLFQGKKAAYTIQDAEPFAVSHSSTLFRGKDPNGEPVCLKLFRALPVDRKGQEAVDQFTQELEAHKRLQHPNILPLLDYGSGTKEKSRPFLVYPFCVGGNLLKLSQGRAFLPFAEALSILEPIAMALDFAHASGFIHGDIKPQNILFKEPATGPMLSDFGISRYFPLVTKVGDTEFFNPKLGSTLYLAPEQLEDGLQSPKSDIYSFAVVAYQILTGGIPFEDNIPIFRHMQAKVAGKIINPQDLNPQLPDCAASALLLGLSVNRKKRPETAHYFCELLRGARDSGRSARVPETGTEAEDTESHNTPASAKNSFWATADSKTKVAIISVIVTALAGVITAAINILPKLLK